MKYNIYLVLILLSFNSRSQNLVNNPSFETSWECPVNNGQFGVSDWYRPLNHQGTADYLNTCSVSFAYGIPENVYGNQSPYEGQGYCGSILYDENFIESREYMQIQLTTPLIANQDYYVSFYVSLGEQCRFATSNIQALLTNNAVTGNGTMQNIPLTPQISGNVIVDNTSGWTEISGTYHAVGGEQFLTIGNFNNDAQTQLLTVIPVFGISRAYYYFDNVSVTATTLGINENNISDNLSIYPNPTNGIFTIQQNKVTELDIEIYNIIGERIYKTKLNSLLTTIELNNQAKGVYFVRITENNKSVIIRKIIIQ